MKKKSIFFFIFLLMNNPLISYAKDGVIHSGGVLPFSLIRCGNEDIDDWRFYILGIKSQEILKKPKSQIFRRFQAKLFNHSPSTVKTEEIAALAHFNCSIVLSSNPDEFVRMQCASYDNKIKIDLELNEDSRLEARVAKSDLEGFSPSSNFQFCF